MEYRTLGQTPLKVSAISYGNWLNSDDPTTIQRNKQIVKHAWDLGINFYDTAEGYGFGQAEIQLGQALNELMQEKGIKREDLVVSTKIFMGTSPWAERKPNTSFLSRKHIIEGLRASLKRLNFTYVDIVFAHRFDEHSPLEEIVRAFDWCVRHGLATYWGTSEWSPQQIIEAYGICDRLSLIKPISEQPQYNMFVRDRFEWEYESLFNKFQMGSTVWSPLAQGVLSGKYNDSLQVEGSRLNTMQDNIAIKNITNRLFGSQEALQKTQDKLKALETLSQELGCSQAQLAMAWVLKNRDVSTAITSASKIEQLDDTVKSLQVMNKLTPEIEQRIDKILQNKPKTVLQFSTLSDMPTRRDKYV